MLRLKASFYIKNVLSKSFLVNKYFKNTKYLQFKKAQLTQISFFKLTSFLNLKLMTKFCSFLPQIFLLPCHSDKSKRRTKTLASTNEPRWGQTFIFSGLRRADLNNRLIEVSFFIKHFFLNFLNFNNSIPDHSLGLRPLRCE